MREDKNLDPLMILDRLDNKQINQKMEAVSDFYVREDDKMSFARHLLERICHFIGKPIFLALILFFVGIWIASNLLLSYYLNIQFDPPPFQFLQGIIALSALLTATIVVSNQNRLARLEEQRAHLDLKVNLLTEQKTAKIIEVLEELRLDLPNVKKRTDSEATQLKQALNPHQVMAALDEWNEPNISHQDTSSAQIVDGDGKKLE